ncbi:MAG: N-methylhydantoinase A/oxoprolinase/acetone carboxylase beta subunit [Gammaproteobacteria bacterium]|jgi:N-methylhydantoinase A/oxoprolinase/acetone carboxylase beta subunit
MKKFNIGIDTGGTYTDAVIVDTQTRKVIGAEKALTTKGHLEIGVANALGAVIRSCGESVSAEQISLVSLSTTLATNALVEGSGSTVAAITIGFSADMIKRSHLGQAIPTAPIISISGGHQYDGSETCPLDEESLRIEVSRLKDLVEAFSISANYSVRNPSHEQRAREIIGEICDKPVTISSELSDGLNGPLRALTATFNVRIVSLILNLVESVRHAMADFNIDAPLMIVKGDGSIASADSIIAKPIETILSGPAASVIGANFISQLNDFIISDVGGTTTDVAIVKQGWPEINESGAMAGGYRTLVRAIDMQTIGLGGDSEVFITHKGEVGLKTNRVLPLSLLAYRFPEVISQLESSLADGMGLARAIRFILLPEGSDKTRLPSSLVEADLEFINKIELYPKPFDQIVVRASDRARVERLIDRGLVQVSGITPSDAAHALNLQSQWSQQAARLGCLMLARSHSLISWDDSRTDDGIAKFAQSIFSAMVAKSAYLMINQLTGIKFSEDDPFIKAITKGGHRINDLQVSLKPTIPIVGVGGPAQVFYPAVGEMLNVETLIPRHADVANAIGAAIGHIKIRTVVEITKNESGGYQLHHPGKPLFFADSITALAEGSTLASDQARSRALAMGGSEADIQIDINRVDLPDMDPKMSLISATITAECLSTPGFH